MPVSQNINNSGLSLSHSLAFSGTSGHDVIILHESTTSPPHLLQDIIIFNSYFHFVRPQLTSSDVDKRCLGVRLLSDVLHRLVGIPMQEKEGCTLKLFSIPTLPPPPIEGFLCQPQGLSIPLQAPPPPDKHFLLDTQSFNYNREGSMKFPFLFKSACSVHVSSLELRVALFSG